MTATSLARPRAIDRSARTILAALGSGWFLGAVVAVALLSSLIVALSADYFLLYDEFYHFGIIRLMAERGTPFLTGTESVTGLGDVERYGSYFYHALMGAPYSLATALGWGEYGHVLLLRVLTVVMAIGSLPVFAKALRTVGVGSATSNVAILVFSSVPVLSFVSATINYDGLVLLFSAVFALLIARAATEQPMRAITVLLAIAVGSLGSITKYTFLPVFAAGMIGLVVLVIVRSRSTGSAAFRMPRGAELRSARFWASAALALVAVGLFCERYLVNLLMFGTPSPDCAVVHNADYCATWGPWGRNEELDAAYPDHPFGLGPLFTYLARMWSGGVIGTIDVIGGETSSGIVTASGVSTYTWLAAIGTTIAIFIVVLVLPRVFRNGAATVLLSAAVVYTAALFWTNYSDLRTMGVPIGIQSRYLLPIAPLLLGAAGLGLSRILTAIEGRPLVWKCAAVVVLLFAALQGGWALSYLISSDPEWFHPDNPISGLLPALQRLAQFVVLTA